MKRQPKKQKSPSPFAGNLKRLLEERGITLRGAAEIAQVRPSVMHGWAQGAAPADLIAVQRLARGLGCAFEWLLTGAESNTKVQEMPLSELFVEEDAPSFTGLFQIQAKRLRRKTGGT